MIERENRAGKPSRQGGSCRAFSLVEMLVVIAIIGVLAAILLGVLPGVMHRKVMARVQVELTQLQNAIEYYKEKNGFYPPDNNETPKELTRPPLFYELVGTGVDTVNNTSYYYPLNGETNRLSETDVQNAFGTKGFLNSGEPGEVKNFYPTLKSSQYQRSPNDSKTIFLVAPAKGPSGEFNPWRYVVAKPNPRPNEPLPTHNPSSYDLWAEVVYRGRTNVVGNWKQ